MTLESVSGVIATACGAAFVWPQVVRVYRRKTTQGLSAATVVIGLINPVFWTVFGYSTGRTIAVFANTHVGIAFMLIAAKLVRAGELRARLVLAMFAGTVAYCLSANSISPQIVGVTGLFVSTPSFLPQLWRALRSRDLYGVSIWSNVLFAAQCLFWTIYGVEVREPLYIYPNAFLLPCALVIAWQVWRSRRSLRVGAS